MITYSQSESADDLTGILYLQSLNLPEHLTVEEKQSQGFVTVHHNYLLLEKLNKLEKHIIAKDNNKVIGYVLAMTKQSKEDIPVLFPMFGEFDKIIFRNQKISDFNYLIVGQVCIDKAYRGKGIFDHCYSAFRKSYRNKYDFAITEIASANHRSLAAHKRIGFREIHSYYSSDGTEWLVVLWDWKADQL